MENGLLVQQYKDVTVVKLSKRRRPGFSQYRRTGAKSPLAGGKAGPPQNCPEDFSAVRFMSSQALGVLIQLKRRHRRREGGIIVIAGIRPKMHKVFKITNLHKLFAFHSELDKALGEFDIFIPKA